MVYAETGFSGHGGKTPRRPKRGSVDALVTVLLPWLVFTLIICLFTFAYEEFGPLVWALLVASGLLALLFIALGGSAGRAWHLALGFLIILSLGVAVPIGLFIEQEYMREYWRLDNGAIYRQVNSFDPASSHMDATVLEFREGTYVDSAKSVGYMWAGIVYCAAPVSSKVTGVTVQYWAVGINCCGQRGSFSCDDVSQASALSGVSLLDPTGNYRTAVRMAESVYNLPKSEGTTAFVKWTNNAVAYKDSLWTSAAVFVAVVSVGHLVLCSCAGVVVIRFMPK